MREQVFGAAVTVWILTLLCRTLKFKQELHSQSQLLVTALSGRQEMIAQVLWSLKTTCKTQVEFQAPDFNLVQSLPIQACRKRIIRWGNILFSIFFKAQAFKKKYWNNYLSDQLSRFFKSRFKSGSYTVTENALYN